MTLGESDPVQNKFSIHIRCHFFRKSSGDGSSIEFRSLTAYTDRMNSALSNRNTFLDLQDSFDKVKDKAVKALEKIIGIESVGYSYSLATADIDRQVLESNTPLYLEDNNQKLQQVFPQLGFIGKQALRPFSGIPAILAPIALEGHVEGTLYLAGAQLVEADKSAISIFKRSLGTCENRRGANRVPLF